MTDKELRDRTREYWKFACGNCETFISFTILEVGGDRLAEKTFRDTVFYCECKKCGGRMVLVHNGPKQLGNNQPKKKANPFDTYT